MTRTWPVDATVQFARGLGGNGAPGLAWHRRHGLKATPRALRDAWRLGQHGTDWYDGAMNALNETMGADASLMASLIAATSPLTWVRKNIQDALTARELLKRGAAFEAYDWGLAKPTIVRNLERVQRGEPVQGQKCAAFERAIRGDMAAIVVDRWIWRLFYGRDSGTERQHALVCTWVRSDAAQYDLAPARYQAGLWCGVKRQHGMKRGQDDAPLRDVIREIAA